MVFSILQNCEIITTIYYNFRIFGSFKKNPIPISNHLPHPLNQVLTTPDLLSVYGFAYFLKKLSFYIGV